MISNAFLLIAILVGLAEGLSSHRKIYRSANSTIPVDISPAVFVTPLLPDRFLEAQTIASMELLDEYNMYSGFFSLDTKSHTYFIFSKALNGNHDAPILLWLQGGPGASSLFGFFTELGPFYIDEDMQRVKRNYHWNEEHHLLVLDNPLGTGFSFTSSPERMPTNQTTIGQDLYKALTQFFQLFPDLRANDFYVTGESYAGKYVPSCAYEIHEQNKKHTNGFINLKGIAIGDGAFDPSHQFYNFGELLFYLGMADQAEREQYEIYENKWKIHMDSGDYQSAFEVFDEMLNGDFYPYPTYYANTTGMGTNYFNFNQGPDGSSLTKNYFIDWLNTREGRDTMHVGNFPFDVFNQTVESRLKGDWMIGVVDKLTVLLESEYKVLIYNGQYDIILGPPLTEQALQILHWSGQQEYLTATKNIWKIPRCSAIMVEQRSLSPEQPPNACDNNDRKAFDVAGYYRTVGNFTQLCVRGAGHMVPSDQPLRALDMIERFVQGKPFGKRQ